MHIGERIKMFRKNLGLTQKQLGEKVNKSPQVISNIERAYTPNLSHEDLLAISRALEISVETLLGTADSKLPEPSPKKPKDLLKLLEEEQELAMNGEILTAEDKEVIKSALEQGYYLAKKLNKRKKT